jgi:phosphatidylglycerophosphatase A
MQLPQRESVSVITATRIQLTLQSSLTMAILRKNRLNTPTASPDRDNVTSTPPRSTRTTFRALFSSSPTSFAAPISPPTFESTPSSSSAAAASNRFNPRLIFAQIVAIQSIHYLVLSFLFQINHLLTGTSITLDRIFTARYLELWTTQGWIDNSAIIISSVIGAILLALIVEKSKKCLDFSITLFAIHFVICTLYGGFPDSWDWWIINVLGLIIMVLLGEYLCSRVELRDIPLL